jgi:ATP-dependent Clp protease ATP-binding subunit ClpC
MRKNFVQFAGDRLRDFGRATINLFIFLPYFFSVAALTKTLFNPWKNLVSTKKAPGFALVEWLNQVIFNFISRSIGFVMRSSVITFYFLLQAVFMLGLPLVALSYFIFLPLMYLEYLFQKTPEEVKASEKNKFTDSHSLTEASLRPVTEWFETYHHNHLYRTRWWELRNLFETPPLARDWSAGFTPTIDRYTIDLATPAYLHHLKNIIGRETEISAMERALSKNIESNIIVSGEEGVGKHTIIDALARKIYLGKTTTQLMYKRLLKLNMEKVLAEFTDESKRESFFENILEEASQAKNIILFIDGFEKYVDYAALFQKYATGSDLQIIGVTTPYAYEKSIFQNEKINRLFQKIDVYEVKKDEALKILLESSYSFEKYHGVILPYETIVETVEKSEFYLTYIPFPEKAVDLLDAACVYAKAKSMTSVTPDVVNAVLTEKTHVPTMVTGEMKEKLLNMESKLAKKIVQQTFAISKLSSALRRSFLLIGKRKKPLATFMFLGPTGVGKTETAKVIAEIFFGHEQPLRFDMSIYQSKNDIPRLIGDPTFSQPGLLSAAIREKPYGVLLLDEIEKADPDLLNIFLTIFDEGYFTDGAGHRVDCKNLLIIATSNAGSDVLYGKPDVDIIDHLVENKIFSPEFLNRFDGIIRYEPLSRESIMIMARKMIGKIAVDVLSVYKVHINVSQAMLEKLVTAGHDPRFGARNLERVIRDEIEDKISKALLSGNVKEGEMLNF